MWKIIHESYMRLIWLFYGSLEAWKLQSACMKNVFHRKKEKSETTKGWVNKTESFFLLGWIIVLTSMGYFLCNLISLLNQWGQIQAPVNSLKFIYGILKNTSLLYLAYSSRVLAALCFKISWVMNYKHQTIECPIKLLIGIYDLK